ncbi:exosome component 10 [Scaptodrosophila lebanonensis]|uniref:Exosome complex component 10 homolog n=1 Tax=Drosophila lebanonensis TaxID=7225 RepID=A0A6J2T2I8_DROLE|nr:exosome component 10 [Scaptodrosophila lebanonensis]
MSQAQKRNHSKQSQTTTATTKADAEGPQKKAKPSSEIVEFSTQAFRNVVAATRACNAFPQGTARELYLTYPEYSKMMDEQSQRVMGLIGKVLSSQEVKGARSIQRRQLDEQTEMVQECNDILFERISTNLDLKSGLRRNPHVMLETQVSVLNTAAASPSAVSGAKENGAPGAKVDAALPEQTTNVAGTPRAGSWNRTLNNTPRGVVSARLFAAKNIMRPQMQFKVPVDNSSTTPFVPRLREKPNSLKPLALLPEYDDAGNIASYLHPYEFELLKFEPKPAQLERKKPELPPAMTETELMLVDSVDKLEEALEELRQVSEIAIDVEHHSYRTFMGITCLVQMSTRHKDYIFDTLTLRDDMHRLNLVLTDPKVVKILHGADLDIEWLQRDLALYIVNMFDTHRAAKALNMARLSLAFLLKHYVDLDVDKSFQLADWRMRPLPPQLIDYARQDTHYLIYIYERLTNDLLESEHGKPQAVRAVYQISMEVCKKRYVKPHISQDSHLDLVRKTKRAFDNRQLYALHGIFHWRDATARQEDESYGYVLPNHMMLQIAESLPREMQGILACCNPIPPLVRQQLHTLHQIVLRAREQPLVKPILETSSITIRPAPLTKDLNSKLHCPHDFSHLDETPDDLPTLLKRDASGKLRPTKLEAVKCQPLAAPALRLFQKSVEPTEDEQKRWWRAHKERQAKRMPYKRYLAILPLMVQQKREEATRAHNELLKRRLCPATPAPDDIKLEPSTTAAAAEDDMYSMPLKEQLKRKYQAKSGETSAPKRVKKDEDTQPQTKIEVKTEAPAAQIDAPPAAIQVDSDTDDDAVEEVPVERQPQPMPAKPTTSKQKKRLHNQQRFKAKTRVHNQSSNMPVQLPQQPKRESVPNFDYKNVDFRQFRGGAQRARGTEIKPQVHGKNRPNNRNNKQFNKLFTFSNVKKDGKK